MGNLFGRKTFLTEQDLLSHMNVLQKDMYEKVFTTPWLKEIYLLPFRDTYEKKDSPPYFDIWLHCNPYAFCERIELTHDGLKKGSMINFSQYIPFTIVEIEIKWYEKSWKTFVTKEILQDLIKLETNYNDYIGTYIQYFMNINQEILEEVHEGTSTEK